MVVVFTDGSASALQGLYLLLGSQDEEAPPLHVVNVGDNMIVVEKPEIEAIIVDEGVCPMEKSLSNVISLVKKMQLNIPIYAGSSVSKDVFISPLWDTECSAINIELDEEEEYTVIPASSLLIDNQVDAISFSSLTTVARWVEQGLIASLTMFAGGDTSDHYMYIPMPEVDMSIHLDPDAYRYVMESDVPKIVYTLDEVTNEKMLKARMIAMSSPLLYSLIPKRRGQSLEASISTWKFWHMIFVMELLGYF